MSTLVIEVIIILLLVATNGVLALSEMAIVTARKARLQQRVDEGDQSARAALEVAENPTRFFSTTQIGITLIGVLSGAFGGATLTEVIAANLSKISVIAPYGEAIGIAFVVVAITYLSLVFGELVPKRLAQNNAEQIASRIAKPMQALSRGFAPVVSLLSISTDFILRLLRAQNPRTQAVTEEEVMIMLKEGTELGVFEAIEHDILKRVLRLADRKVSTMMTHRTDVIWLDMDDDLERLNQEIKTSQYSRLPVGRGSLDGLIGVLEVRDYLSHFLTDSTPDIQSHLQKPLFVPEAMTALELLELFRQTRNHLAVVVDEFGGVTGIITTTDVLESIVGSLPELGEPDEPEAIQRADGSWLFDGKIPVEEAIDRLERLEIPDEESRDYETLGGLMMQRLGRIPSSGDYFEWNGLRFEVVDMDGHRVDKVLVSPVKLTGEP